MRDLVVLSKEPFNAETKLAERRGFITPAGEHYVRSHFTFPDAPSRIDIAGTGGVALADVRALPARTLAVTLECAGNGRSLLAPKVPGEQWALGAVGTARWTGALLRDVLARAGARPGGREVVFTGADSGVPKDIGTRIFYERSLPVDVALADDVIVAYAMNGAPIPPEHGGPLRLVVPGWYGMASVKWLSRVHFSETRLVAFYQTERYVIDGQPLQQIEPRAIITAPSDGAEVAASLELRGYAWSGRAAVADVEISVDERRVASLRTGDGAWVSGGDRFAWREFAFTLTLASGEHAIAAQAHDAAGNTQPLEPRWNALGYANNAVRPVRVRVRA